MNRNKRKITAPTAAFSQTAKLPEKEVILRIGAEGGSITLFGTSSQRGWLYNMSVDECIDDDRFQYESNVVDSWEAALTLLDQYPWHRLSPLKVHPEFRTQIWTAVQRRFGRSGEPTMGIENWREICGKTDDTSRTSNG